MYQGRERRIPQSAGGNTILSHIAVMMTGIAQVCGFTSTEIKNMDFHELKFWYNPIKKNFEKVEVPRGK